jgi:RNA polymerase sigma factor (TIGR02999 family)
MTDITRMLSAIEQGDACAAEQLLPLVYDELRKLAAMKMAHERPGQTLDATGLVHEAYLRLVESNQGGWDNRRHFFAAAAEAMRRILIEGARRRQRLRHGGDQQRVDLQEADLAVAAPPDELLMIHEALEELARSDASAAELVKLRYFAGLSVEHAAEVLGIPVRTAYRNWAYARAWLFRQAHAQARHPAP